MRLTHKHFLHVALLALALFSGITACVKRDFDEPPTSGEPVNVTANTTIADFKKLHVSIGSFDKITTDIIIEGTVVMDDRSGNYYKTLVIQDASGGIEIKFNDGYLYNQFPVGRKIYIYCKDLYLTDYNGLTQLAGSLVYQNGVPDAIGLTESQVRAKVVKGNVGAAPAPQTVGVDIFTGDNADHLLSTLIKLENVQFSFCDAGRTYADAVTQYSLNRILEDCVGNHVILRSSGFANFAAANTPRGNGSLVGVLGKYGSDYQLYIRDLSDVTMSDDRATRCGGSGSAGGTLTDISAIRSLFTGSAVKAPNGLKIKGVVISDRLNKNLNDRNVYLQDASGGIVVRFLSSHCFDVGDEIEVNVSNQEISEFNGLRQVNNVPLENAGFLASAKNVTPRAATVSEILANFDAWESTLVEISNATISGGATYSGGKTVADGTGSIAMFTQSYATFATGAVPTAAVKLTAIVSDFNGKQIIMRNLGDVKP